MKRVLLFCLTLALLLGCLALPASASEGDASQEAAPDRGVTINVYNWGEYIANGTDGSMDINAEFTRRTGIQVNYTTFDSNESLYSKLAGGGADYDIIIPSDYMISRMIEEGNAGGAEFRQHPQLPVRGTSSSATRPTTRAASTRCPIPGAWWGCSTTRTTWRRSPAGRSCGTTSTPGRSSCSTTPVTPSASPSSCWVRM